MPQRQQYLSALGITDWQQRRPLQVQAPVAAIRSEAATAYPAPGIVALEPRAPLVAAPQIVIPPPQTPTREAPAPGTDSWEALAAEVAPCTRCELASCRTQTVFGVGDRNANWLIVGEAPGAEEDRQGEPFVGRAGQLLNAMLLGIGLKREQVYIANVLKCRPPNNRDPKPEEVAQCLPYLERQIALLQPRIMLAVGRIAAQNLLATDTPIGKLRGRLHAFGAAKVPLVVTYHPAYLLRSPTEKRKAWEDLKFARGVAREQGA
jgi:DNA polymerase